MRYILAAVALLLTIPTAQAQQVHGIGLRFASDNCALRAPRELPVIRSRFSNMVLGLTYKNYRKGGGIEASLSYLRKGPTGFVVVAQDFDDLAETRYTGLEAEARFGPRLFNVLFPKFGLAGRYFFDISGFLGDGAPADYNLNRWHLSLPLGATVDFPTQWGTVGAGMIYYIGLTNVVNGQGLERGGKWDGLRIEIHAMLQTNAR